MLYTIFHKHAIRVKFWQHFWFLQFVAGLFHMIDIISTVWYCFDLWGLRRTHMEPYGSIQNHLVKITCFVLKLTIFRKAHLHDLFPSLVSTPAWQEYADAHRGFLCGARTNLRSPGHSHDTRCTGYRHKIVPHHQGKQQKEIGIFYRKNDLALCTQINSSTRFRRYHSTRNEKTIHVVYNIFHKGALGVESWPNY